MEATSEYLSVSAASRHLGVPRGRVTALIARGVLTPHRSELDRRSRLVRVDDLHRLAPQPERETPRKEALTA